MVFARSTRRSAAGGLSGLRQMRLPPSGVTTDSRTEASGGSASCGRADLRNGAGPGLGEPADAVEEVGVGDATGARDATDPREAVGARDATDAGEGAGPGEAGGDPKAVGADADTGPGW